LARSSFVGPQQRERPTLERAVARFWANGTLAFREVRVQGACGIGASVDSFALPKRFCKTPVLDGWPGNAKPSCHYHSDIP
jgi:hypothetical protein